MNNVPSEIYDTELTLCGQRLVLEVFGEGNAVSKMTLGNRFFIAAKCYPINSDNPELVRWFIDYYRNYAPLLDWEELAKGWKCYQKAKKQRSDSTSRAFWAYLAGKRIQRLGRKGATFRWI